MFSIKKKLLVSVGAMALALGASAQTLLGGADFSAKLPANFSVNAGVEYRTQDWLKHSGQWSIEAGAAYKPLKPLKLAVGYKFLQSQTLSPIGDFWVSKHRVSVSATGQWKPVGGLTLSLRERYQYTYRPELTVGMDDGSNKTVNSKSKHILRSRLQADYRPYKKCPWKPYVSYELYSLLSDVNHTKHRTAGAKFCDKWRLTAGTEFKINKHNSLDLFYRYADTSDIDETETHHTIGLVYSFSL